MAKLFTEEELEELCRADAELDKLDNKGRKIAKYQAAYREANKDKIALRKAAYYEANKQKLLDYQREYRRKKREAKKNAASGGANT